ncbi:MAG: T9SS type A sorting domain-containing protein [Bacteroidia bacterium]|nr:T9SS type A sorting domain-containing protein [Bacteroidia bacterium]
MIKKWLILCFALVFGSISIIAQNLVPNPSFEQYTSCPNSQNQLYKAVPWMNPSTGLPGTQTGTPDYFNECSYMYVPVPRNLCGFQWARTGSGYAGIHLWASNPDSVREYIEVPLTAPLTAGECYHFEMYFNHANYYQYTCANLGVYFSDTAVTGVNNFFPLPFQPQIVNPSTNVADTLNWTLMSGDYLAEGGESYIIIGNFDDEAHTDTLHTNPSVPVGAAYIYIDDVSLIPTTPCNVTGTHATVETQVLVFPNPAHSEVHIVTPSAGNAQFMLLDIAGRSVLQTTFQGEVSLNLSELPIGIYFYRVLCTDGSIKSGRLIKE